jgi:hypothetical protein
VALAPARDPIVFPGMQSVTNLVYSGNQRLLICLSSCSEVFLIDADTAELVHQYPASLMSCGSALSTMAGVEVPAVPGSTFLILGGIDGSFSLRELNRRDRDGKLQCVLHRCIDRLAPHLKTADADELSLDPADGCPLSSLYVLPDLDVCVVGDASCAVYVVGLKLLPMTPAPTPSLDPDTDARRASFDQETVLEPSIAGADDDDELADPLQMDEAGPESEGLDSTQTGQRSEGPNSSQTEAAEGPNSSQTEAAPGSDSVSMDGHISGQDDATNPTPESVTTAQPGPISEALASKHKIDAPGTAVEPVNDAAEPERSEPISEALEAPAPETEGGDPADGCDPDDLGQETKVAGGKNRRRRRKPKKQPTPPSSQ